MMWRSLTLLPVVAMASCSDAPSISTPPQTPQEQACAAQANEDPALKEARAISAGRLEWEWMHGPEIAQLKRDAITRCLRGRGLTPRGGVERAR